MSSVLAIVWRCSVSNRHSRLPATFSFPKFTVNWYPGKTTTLGFANGTTKPYATIAAIDPSLWPDDISDGLTLYNAFCIEPARQAASSPTPVPVATVPVATDTVIPANRAYFEHAPAYYKIHLAQWQATISTALRIKISPCSMWLISYHSLTLRIRPKWSISGTRHEILFRQLSLMAKKSSSST